MSIGGDNLFYRQLCEGLGFVCVAVDRELKIAFCNAATCATFGESAEELIGRSFLDLLGEADRPDIERSLHEVIEFKHCLEREVKDRRQPGDVKTLVLILSPIVDASGQCVGVSASMRDISLRKQLARDAAHNRRMDALGRMSGAVAHHFNNILGGMLTSVDSVLTSDSPRELRRTLRLLAQAIGRATRITNQLAAFAESENDLVEWSDLNHIMEDFLRRLEARARRAKINLEADVAKVDSGPFEAQRLVPVLDSLVQNALDAMTEGGSLTLRMIEEDEKAVITITDTGCGIPADVLDRVFEPFFTTKGELGVGGKIGLGLAAVHGLVSEMGGTLQLQSEPAEGTEVVVRLPLRRARVVDTQLAPGETL